MLKKIVILGSLLILVLTTAACGNDDGGDSDASNATSAESTSVTLNQDYADALPVSSQLAIGTLMLEETEDAVTIEQAGELLPSWQMLQALQSSGTAAQAELDAVLNQIQRTMTNVQLSAIKEMQLTSDSLMELAQERGLGRGFAGNAGGEGGFRPPAGVIPGGGGGPGGGFGSGAGGFGRPFAAGENLSPEEQETALAERMNTFFDSAVNNVVISLLEARAEGESWEITAPNRDFGLQRALLAAVAEATGLDQQQIMTQTREGQTLLEIAEANDADADEILARVVASESERINQAVADGSMEQADADDWLADLEARAKETLKGTLQFGGRGAQGGTSEQP